jgi:hypothetical protein
MQDGTEASDAVEFTLFDVVCEDGSLRSNRRVTSDVSGASMAMPLRVPSSKNRIGSSRRSRELRPMA